MLQEKRLASKPKSDANIPSSYSADYFHRGKEYDEKLRRGLLLAPFQDYFDEKLEGTLLINHMICGKKNKNVRPEIIKKKETRPYTTGPDIAIDIGEGLYLSETLQFLMILNY